MAKLSDTQEQVLDDLKAYGGYIAAFHHSGKDGGTEYKMMVGSVEHRGVRKSTLDALVDAGKVMPCGGGLFGDSQTYRLAEVDHAA